MKKLMLMAVSSLLALNVFAVGNKGNGGDPYAIHAVKYPHPQKITESLIILEKKLKKSNLPLEITLEAFEEALQLEQDDSYKYIETITILPGTESQLGHSNRNIDESIVGLGAYTLNRIGAQVYFSKMTLAYSTDELAKLILHEVFHHTLPEFLRNDELFVEKLTQEVWNGEVSVISHNSLTLGYYIPRNEITKIRVLRAMAIVIGKYEEYADILFNSELVDVCISKYNNSKLILDECYNILNRLVIELPDDFANINLEKLMKLRSFDRVGMNDPARRNHFFRLLESILYGQGYDFPDYMSDFCEKGTSVLFIFHCSEYKNLNEIIIGEGVLR